MLKLVVLEPDLELTSKPTSEPTPESLDLTTETMLHTCASSYNDKIYIKEHTVLCAFFSFSLLTVITVTEAPHTDLNEYTQSEHNVFVY